MAGVGDKLMTASEIKAVTDTKLAKNFSSLSSIDHSLENNYLFAVQRSDKSQASKITYSALGTDILNKIGSNGVVSVDHGGTGASDGSGARTNLDVYSKSETNNAIAQSMVSESLALSLFTSIDSHVNTNSFFKLRVGNVVYLSIRIDGAVTVGSSGVKLFDIDASVAPRQQNVTCPVFSSSGSIVSNTSVWIEAHTPTKVTLYGASLPTGAYYCNLTYVI